MFKKKKMASKSPKTLARLVGDSEEIDIEWYRSAEKDQASGPTKLIQTKDNRGLINSHFLGSNEGRVWAVF